MQKKHKKYVLIFLLPSLILFVIFQIVPLIWSFALSFTDWNIRTDPNFVFVDNYIKMFTSSDFWSSCLHTLQYVFIEVPLVIFFGMILALLVNQKFKGISFFRGAYFIPVVSSWVAVSLIWKGLLNPKFGMINQGLSVLGIQGPSWLFDPSWAMWGVILASTWKDMGFAMVLLLGGLQNVDKQLLEASSLDGANSWKRFWKITLPLISPSVFLTSMISAISAFQVFEQVWVMTEGGPAGATSVLVEHIYKNAFKYSQMGYAAALSWVLMLIILVISLIQNKLEKKWVVYS